MKTARTATPAALAPQVERAGLRPDLIALLLALEVPAVLDLPTPQAGTAGLLGALEAALADGPAARIWLALAVLTAQLPDEATVLRAVRATRLDGPLAAFAPVLAPGLRGRLRRRPSVEIRTGEVLVDVHHTARTELATGIQRVARHSARIWARDQAPSFVGWTRGYTALRPLEDPEIHRALHGGPAAPVPPEDVVVVPWRCRYLLPELMTEPERAARLLALLRFGAAEGSMIGFDVTPVSTAETVAGGMAAGFTAMLGALAWGPRIAAISTAAAAEYAGWRAMLAGVGLPGPLIRAIPLATEGAAPDPPSGAETGGDVTAALGQAELPLVLCVGSHEPRKNHLGVLNAAQVLWDEGLTFALAFVGGNSWRSEEFLAAVAEAAAAGRPVSTVTALPDDLLSAAYRQARVTVFPSLNEGFGLPVAESLAAGTPVITGRFGSTAEIAQSGGALLVDPRQDREIVDALRRLLCEDELHARLSAEAREFPVRSWESYATETWEFLVTAPSMSADGAEPR